MAEGRTINNVEFQDADYAQQLAEQEEKYYLQQLLDKENELKAAYEDKLAQVESLLKEAQEEAQTKEAAEREKENNNVSSENEDAMFDAYQDSVARENKPFTETVSGTDAENQEALSTTAVDVEMNSEAPQRQDGENPKVEEKNAISEGEDRILSADQEGEVRDTLGSSDREGSELSQGQKEEKDLIVERQFDEEEQAEIELGMGTRPESRLVEEVSLGEGNEAESTSRTNLENSESGANKAYDNKQNGQQAQFERTSDEEQTTDEGLGARQEESSDNNGERENVSSPATATYEQQLTESKEALSKEYDAKLAEQNAILKDEHEARVDSNQVAVAAFNNKQQKEKEAPEKENQNQQADNDLAGRNKVIHGSQLQKENIEDSKKRNRDGVDYNEYDNSLETNDASPASGKALVDLAKEKQWGEIKVEGDASFRRDAWLEAQKQGIEVEGYSPTQADREEAAAGSSNERSSELGEDSTLGARVAVAIAAKKVVEDQLTKEQQAVVMERIVDNAQDNIEHGREPAITISKEVESVQTKQLEVTREVSR